MGKREKLLLTAAGVVTVVIMGWLVFLMDFSAPELTLVRSYEKGCGVEISAWDLVERINDKSTVSLTMKVSGGQLDQDGKSVIFDRAGKFSAEVTATDAHGNHTSGKTTIIVTDTVPPVLTVETVTIYEDETPDYRAAVKAEDEMDGDLSDLVEVDDSRVNYSKSGTYIVTYTVSDSSGNQASSNGQLVVCPTPADDIDLNERYIELSGNQYFELKAKVKPQDWDGTVTWESSDKHVATVFDGLVYWTGPGECTITARADKHKAECKVVCTEVQPSCVVLNRKSITLDEGQSKTLTAGALPSNWTGSFTWKSSNPSVATVSNGTVTWVSNGTCYVTAYAADWVYASCEVSCTGGFSFNDLLDSIFGKHDDNEGETEQKEHQSTTVKPQVKPTEAEKHQKHQ